jgi:lipoprotein-anchoring transpeptidase ErfK/SrfK
MKMDGVASPQVWSALLAAAAAGQIDSQPYDYLVASESIPQTLKVYRDGQVIYSTLVNTGVPGAATQQGTFPVYLRYATTTMSGTNVDGSKYVDAGIPWVAYFNGGDAVHGFVRPSYGSPQSNGCVELPVSNAANVWPLDPYGTLVTVTS